MAKYIFAVEIVFPRDISISNGNDIGYYYATPAHFRWIENDISSYTPTVPWSYGILAPTGVGDSMDKVNIERTGNVPVSNLFSIIVTNTLLYNAVYTQLDKILFDNDVSLNGLLCKIIRFEISSGALVDADGTIESQGFIEDVQWTEKTFVINVSRPGFKRRANMVTKVNTTQFPDAVGDMIGKDIPVTMGVFKPEYSANNITWNGFAKFQRTANRATKFETDDNYIFAGSAPSTDLRLLTLTDEQGTKAFPVVGDDGNDVPIIYDIQIGTSVLWWIGSTQQFSVTLELTNLIGQYIKVIKGSGEGELRLIEDAEVVVDGGGDGPIIKITIADYFEDILIGNVTATEEDNSWVNIVDFDSFYQADMWRNNNYLDVDGAYLPDYEVDPFYYENKKDTEVIIPGFSEVLTGDAQTLTIADQIVDSSDVKEDMAQFFALPRYAFTSDPGFPIIYPNPTLFKRSPSELSSFLVLPFDDVILSDLSSSALTDKWQQANFSKEVDGWYQTGGDSTVTISVLTGTIANLSDKNHTTHWDYEVASISEGSYVHVLFLKLPDYPLNFKFDSAYLGYNARAISDSTDVNSLEFYLEVKRRFFMGTASTEVLEDSDPINVISGDYFLIESLPDFYFTSSPTTKNKYFYTNQEFVYDAAQENAYLTGYSLFPLPSITDENSYKDTHELGLFSSLIAADAGSIDVVLAQYELALILKKTISIRNEMYAPLAGRVYLETWGGRKSTGYDIEGIPDFIEHALRLQNWSETDESKEWGKEYATSPLIDTSSGIGGFDHTDLSDLAAITAAHQILTYDNGWTDVFIRKLCSLFFLVSFQDLATGNEQIEFIGKKSTTPPAATLDLDDVIGNVSPVKRKRTRNIFCEPNIRYAYNAGAKTFEKEIKITHSDADTYDSSYVIGMSGSEAELAWTRCHLLWLHTRSVEKPPASMTDNDMIYKDTDAKWCLDTWLTYMGAIDVDGSPGNAVFEPKRDFSLSVPYEIGKDWNVMQRIKIQLPHQTDNDAIEAIIYSVNKRRNQEVVDIEFMLYGSTAEMFVYIQDIPYSHPVFSDVQDDMDTEVEEPTNEPDWQDIT